MCLGFLFVVRNRKPLQILKSSTRSQAPRGQEFGSGKLTGSLFCVSPSPQHSRWGKGAASLSIWARISRPLLLFPAVEQEWKGCGRTSGTEVVILDIHTPFLRRAT